MTRQALSYMKAVESGVERAEADATRLAMRVTKRRQSLARQASATRSHQDFALQPVKDDYTIYSA